MNRRELLMLLTGAMAVARPLRAQQKATPVIGFLGIGSPGPVAPSVAAFRQGLSETGYVEGQNVAIEYHWAKGSPDRLPALAADLVGRKVDVIVTQGGILPARAAKDATSAIPIVFTGGDPVEQGLVASFARLGGNLTGFSFFLVELVPKRLELLSELVPKARVIALLANPRTPNSWLGEVQQAALTKGVQLPILKAGTESEIDAVFASLVELHAGALLIGPDPFFNDRREQLVALASRHALPTSYEWRESVVAGGPDQLWAELDSCLSPGRHLRRKDPQGGEAGGSAGPAADDVRAGRQPQDRQGARPDGSAVDPRPRRRGYRMSNS